MQTIESYSSCTALHDLRVQVHLGVGDEERATTQPISLEVRCYSKAPLSSYSDDEGDYICYGELSDLLKNYLTSQPFKLIEYMGMQCFARLRENIARQIGAAAAKNVALWVRIHKHNPPVEQLEGGSSFTYSDLPQTVPMA